MRKVKEIIKDSDLRNRILFTLLMLLIFRIGANIPVLGVDREILASLYSDSNEVFGIYNMISGGSLDNFTFFSLGISPYITASIIVQLLGIVIPKVAEMAKDDLGGKKKIEYATLALGAGLALIQSIGITFGFFRSAITTSILGSIMVVLTLTLGGIVLMFIGKAIDKKGIGNGMSLLIFTGIVSRIATDLMSLYSKRDSIGYIGFILLALLIVVMVLAIVYVQQAQRKIPVNYSARVKGTTKYRGSSSFIPIKVNQGGVIPIIFAITIIQAPLTISYFFPQSSYAAFVTRYLSTSGMPGFYIYLVLDLLLIVFFTMFYADIVFNPVEVALNLRNQGGVIPGVKPGTQTVEKLQNVSKETEKLGAIFLCIIALVPMLLAHFAGISLSLGGTSALITVGVAIELMQTIDNKLLLRREYGFLK